MNVHASGMVGDYWACPECLWACGDSDEVWLERAVEDHEQVAHGLQHRYGSPMPVKAYQMVPALLEATRAR